MTASLSIPSFETEDAPPPVGPDRRVAWLLNHTTLREFEVPLIRSLGYEVYTSKQLPHANDFLSASVDLSDDRYSTLPKAALELLNAHNFYESDFSPDVKRCLNEHFDTVICAAISRLVEQVVHHFSGRILVRVFGREGTGTYEEYFRTGGQRLVSRLRDIENRFWLAPAYPSIPEVESDFLRRRSVVLPLGLSNRIMDHRGENTGVDARLLFVCPRIASHPNYYGKIYEDFKADFGSVHYIVAGHQPVAVKNDPHVQGYADDQTYAKWFRELRVMYYPSREPRHLHYHPLEAIAFGMPLIFLRGGLLEYFGGKDQPGACATPREARRKIDAILLGDNSLIQEIRSAQTRILQEFSFDHCRSHWESAFAGTVMKSALAPGSGGVMRERSRPRRIAVMLPNAYRGGTLRSAKDIAKIIRLTAKRRGDPVEVVFSCVAGRYDHSCDFEDLADAGISVRDTRWEAVPRFRLDQGAAIHSHWLKGNLSDGDYLQPLDGARQFSDCDFWLIVSDRVLRPIVPAAQYGVLTFDYIQRYVPEIFGDSAWEAQRSGFIPLVRSADFVLCTTPSSAADINAYAGVPRRKILQLPMFFECTSQAPAPRFMKDDYIVWVSNSTEHKNHERALRAVLRYYQFLGGTLKLLVVGPGTEVFRQPPADGAEYPYWARTRDFIYRHQELRSNVSIEGEISEARYLSALKNARFMFHPNLYDNGTFSVIDAALVGTPSLSARYPAMEFMNETFRLNLTFFDPHNEKEMAQGMRDMEEKSRTIALPDRAFLETFSWRRNMDRVYDLIMARLNV